MMVEETVDVAQFEEKTETKSIAMSPTSSRSSAEEDESDHRSDTDTTATSEDERDLKSEQISETTIERTEKTEKSQNSVKIEPPSSSSPRVIPAADPEQSEKQYLSLHQYLLPKLRLLKILLEIDLFAGCIIIGNTVLDGFLNSLKTSTATLLTAAILELIMTKQTDARLIIRLLTLLIYEFCGQTLSALNCYARRRAKRPLQKKLGLDLMKAYAALPYEMMLNKEIGRDFTEANPLLTSLITVVLDDKLFRIRNSWDIAAY
jgi:hypothetical protein